MPKATDLNKIKETTKAIFDAVKIEPVDMGIVQHPFVDCYIVPYRKEGNNDFDLLDLQNRDDFLLYREWLFKQIDDETELFKIYMRVRSPWKLTWLKYAKEYMSAKDFAEFLANAWVTEDNPNGDVNVSVRTSISWFKKAKKEYLMDETEYQIWNSLPENLTVYRGVSPGRVALGLSWTTNKEKAEWFQHRFETVKSAKGFLQKANINKKHVLAYFNSRGEEELVVDVLTIKDLVEIT